MAAAQNSMRFLWNGRVDQDVGVILVATAWLEESKDVLFFEIFVIEVVCFQIEKYWVGNDGECDIGAMLIARFDFHNCDCCVSFPSKIEETGQDTKEIQDLSNNSLMRHQFSVNRLNMNWGK